jgi:SAM-dependent methyltransferase
MSHKSVTIDTYNNSAEALAKKFDEFGARKIDIDFVFSFCKKQNPFVIELGCGNGRDAVEICKRTENYTGIDVSHKLIEIARGTLPNKKFIVKDINDVTIPKETDIVFAFASLIHINMESFRVLLEKCGNALQKNGLIFISLKHSPAYEEITKEDEFGTRTYWHYSENDLLGLTKNFIILDMKIEIIRSQKWIDILLQQK